MTCFCSLAFPGIKCSYLFYIRVHKEIILGKVSSEQKNASYYLDDLLMNCLNWRSSDTDHRRGAGGGGRGGCAFVLTCQHLVSTGRVLSAVSCCPFHRDFAGGLLLNTVPVKYPELQVNWRYKLYCKVKYFVLFYSLVDLGRKWTLTAWSFQFTGF